VFSGDGLVKDGGPVEVLHEDDQELDASQRLGGSVGVGKLGERLGGKMCKTPTPGVERAPKFKRCHY
jgi:hypothetical protein